MSSNNGENIMNAFEVVKKTYESVDKLIKSIMNNYDDSKYIMSTKKYLRWKSDNDYRAWYINSFILCFQRTKDGEVKENGWIDSPLYCIDINFWRDMVKQNGQKEPQVYIAKMKYKGMEKWSEGISPSDHYCISQPLHADKDKYEEKIIDSITIKTPKKEYKDEIENKFWGLEKVTYMSIPLLSLNSDNYLDIIFNESIEKLAEYDK